MYGTYMQRTEPFPHFSRSFFITTCTSKNVISRVNRNIDCLQNKLLLGWVHLRICYRTARNMEYCHHPYHKGRRRRKSHQTPRAHRVYRNLLNISRKYRMKCYMPIRLLGSGSIRASLFGVIHPQHPT